MKIIGIIRKIDDLGRVVIPKEIRRSLKLRIGDPVEIAVNKSGEISIKKYSPVGELGNFAREYVESLGFTSGMTALICDTEKFIASSSIGKGSLQGKKISGILMDTMAKSTLYTGGQDEKKPLVPLTDDDDCKRYSSQLICPVVFTGNIVGAVILIGKKQTVITEQKLIRTAADFLGRQMED